VVTVTDFAAAFAMKGISMKAGVSRENSSHFITQLSKSLVVEYADLIEELYEGGGGEKENVN